MKGFIPIPLLVAVIALFAVIASITVLGSPEESARSIEYICEKLPGADECRSEAPAATTPATQTCTKEFEGVEVKYPCPSASPQP